MTTRFLGGLLTAGLLCGATPFVRAAVASDAPEQIPATVQYSAGLADVVKMADAKVEANVITAYIKNSAIAYNPSAEEIIALKQRGVSDEILTALLQRGAELRSQARPATQPNQSVTAPLTYSGAAYPYAVPPAYDYGTEPLYAGYPYGYPDYGYGYPYYGYGWYNYGFPWPFYGAFYFDGFGRRHFHHFDGHRHFTSPTHSGGFRPGGFGGRSVGFGGRPGGFGGRPGGFGGRPGGFTGHFGPVQHPGFGGRSVSFASHGGGFRTGGGFGGRGMGRGR